MCRQDPSRFVLFPLEHDDIWLLYKELQHDFHTAEDLQSSVTPNIKDGVISSGEPEKGDYSVRRRRNELLTDLVSILSMTSGGVTNPCDDNTYAQDDSSHMTSVDCLNNRVAWAEVRCAAGAHLAGLLMEAEAWAIAADTLRQQISDPSSETVQSSTRSLSSNKALRQWSITRHSWLRKYATEPYSVNASSSMGYALLSALIHNSLLDMAPLLLVVSQVHGKHHSISPGNVDSAMTLIRNTCEAVRKRSWLNQRLLTLLLSKVQTHPLCTTTGRDDDGSSCIDECRHMVTSAVQLGADLVMQQDDIMVPNKAPLVNWLKQVANQIWHDVVISSVLHANDDAVLHPLYDGVNILHSSATLVSLNRSSSMVAITPKMMDYDDDVMLPTAWTHQSTMSAIAELCPTSFALTRSTASGIGSLVVDGGTRLLERDDDF